MDEDLIFQCKHVGGAVFNEEDLTSAFSTSCRIHVYYVRVETVQNLLYVSLPGNPVRDRYVPGLQNLEVVFCCPAEDFLHLIVEDSLRFLGEKPAVDTEPAGQVGYGP